MSNIIELSYINSKSSNSSADWVNTFQPIILNTNDSLAFKVGFLDYGNQNQYGVIEIGDDLNLSMTAGFYASTSGYGIDTNVSYDENQTAKYFKLYVARDYSGSTYPLITSTVNFTIAKGVYTPQELSIIINKQLTTLPQSSLGSDADLVNNPTEYFFRSSQIGEAVCEFYQGIYSATNIWRLYVRGRFKNQLNAFKVGDICNCYVEYDPNVNSFECGISEIYIGENDTSYIEISPAQEDPPDQASFQNGYLYKNNTKKHTDITPIRFYDPTNFLNTQYMEFTEASWIGASQIDLQFDFNQSGRFSWEYLHTSLHDKDQNNSTAVAIYGVDGTFFQYQNVFSGIFFTDLQPASFWQGVLGFNLNKLLFTDNITTHNLDKVLSFGDNITGDFIGFDDIYDKTKTAQVITGNLNVLTSQTFNIVGDKLSNIVISPFFIIQLIGLGNPNYATDDKTYQTIAHVGSKEYDNNGSITLFGDGTNFYTNSGEQKIISSLNVRILDGTTKQPTQILGQNNSIFIQINRINPNNLKDF
jgi:hypothetical protein